MPIAAGVVRDAQVGAVLAAFDMTAQRPHGSSPWGKAHVRQRSIADMTLSWPRLTWPAWEARQAGPRWRKMSATSTVGRDNGRYTYRRRRDRNWKQRARCRSAVPKRIRGQYAAGDCFGHPS